MISVPPYAYDGNDPEAPEQDVECASCHCDFPEDQITEIGCEPMCRECALRDLTDEFALLLNPHHRPMEATLRRLDQSRVTFLALFREVEAEIDRRLK